MNCNHIEPCMSRRCPERLHYVAPCGLASFLDRVTELKEDLNIRLGEGSERDRRRIAIAVTDAYVTSGGDLHQDAAFEAELYEGSRGLLCDPIRHEVYFEENCKQRDRGGFDPLKLYCKEPRTPGRLASLVFTVLRGEAVHEREQRGDAQEHPDRRGPDEASRHHQGDLEFVADLRPSVP